MSMLKASRHCCLIISFGLFIGYTIFLVLLKVLHGLEYFCFFKIEEHLILNIEPQE